MSAPNMISPVTQGSNNDVTMQDTSSEDKRVKDLARKKLGVSGAITKPKVSSKKEKSKVRPAAMAPLQRPAAPQPVGLSARDEEDGDLISRLGRLGV